MAASPFVLPLGSFCALCGSQDSSVVNSTRHEMTCIEGSSERSEHASPEHTQLWCVNGGWKAGLQGAHFIFTTAPKGLHDDPRKYWRTKNAFVFVGSLLRMLIRVWILYFQTLSSSHTSTELKSFYLQTALLQKGNMAQSSGTIETKKCYFRHFLT